MTRVKALIVGNGIAGNEVAFALRRARKDWEVTILSAEDVPEYDPCSLPYFIGRDVPRAAQMVEDWERRVINFCKSEDFDMEGLRERYLAPRPTWPPK